MFTQKFIKIFHSVQEIGLFSLFQNLNLGNATANPKWHLTTLGLHLVNINAFAKFYQNIPNGLRVIDIFQEQAGVKIFTNRPGTKSSQTVRWQNQMFDNRALYGIQLQVLVDFLRVVQSDWWLIICDVKRSYSLRPGYKFYILCLWHRKCNNNPVGLYISLFGKGA